jgi:glycosyltransferase involved in cell wall biosynthesis
MNIWFISKYASSLEVGFESRIFAIARRFVKIGHNVSVISSDSNHFGTYPKYQNLYNFEKLDGIEVLRINTLKYKKTASIKRILSWLDFEWKLFFAPLKKNQKPDIIVVSSLSLITILNGFRLKRKYKAKLVFEIRDIWPLTMVAEGGYKDTNPFVKILGKIEKFGYVKSDLIVGTMPNLKVHVENVTGIKNNKCVCVPFGFDANFYNLLNVNSNDFALKYNIPTNKFIIGYAGSIGITNGLDSFITCAKMMCNDNRIIFALLGDGDSKLFYFNETKEQENIIFIPKVKREEVASFLALCNVLYFSSLNSKIWEYGWSPNKLIDYMMAGKPVLASYSGYKSMINEAGSGFFIPSEDADAIKLKIEQLINMNFEDLNNMGIAGKKWIIKNRDWDIVSQNYSDLLCKIRNDG